MLMVVLKVSLFIMPFEKTMSFCQVHILHLFKIVSGSIKKRFIFKITMSLWALNDKVAGEMSPALQFLLFRFGGLWWSQYRDGPIKPLQKCQVIIKQKSGDIIKWKDIELNLETYFASMPHNNIGQSVIKHTQLWMNQTTDSLIANSRSVSKHFRNLLASQLFTCYGFARFAVATDETASKGEEIFSTNAIVGWHSCVVFSVRSIAIFNYLFSTAP